METTKAKIKVDEDIDAVKGDVRRLRDDLTRTVRSVKSRGRNMAMDTRNRIRGIMGGLQDRARQQVRAGSDVIKDRSSDMMEHWRGGITHRPMTSILVAFTIGAVVAFLVRRVRD
jgi:ElaB/YqjD/DUF883 family membrane-anchored ribosome-binding protein